VHERDVRSGKQLVTSLVYFSCLDLSQSGLRDRLEDEPQVARSLPWGRLIASTG